ncbi:glycosyltransferase family 2 protein [Paenibacillus sp. LHD-117]|uniref:glycosyltransferase family A protein n=1 Tax=Paenibacillus sp. LHD-117 TaxID=3071412 RepID=UPI0027E0BDAA|nr:glycosyltransferase family 2 protein [Paenibacillus sp. LHD-117]MDQ6423257.1 glycosyltransferase family 2 protein [Paenibacillus sp. LHD-117]
MKITVFTPTYNRGYIIGTLYQSLQNQTIQDFEWLVIDDGSSDETESLFRQWIEEPNRFAIRYMKVENGGKHRAINKAAHLAKGKLFFIVDSDDALTEDAIEKLVKWEESLDPKGRFCGVSGNRGTAPDQLHGTTFEGSYLDATSLERTKYNMRGDKAEAFYTELLRNYKFVEIDGENFMTEATVWDKMAYDGYKLRWFNDVIYISEYLEDGLTRNIRNVFSKNPKGTAYYFKLQIKHHRYNWWGRMANYYLYYEFVKERNTPNQAADYLGIPPITLKLAISLVKIKRMVFRGVSYEN